MQTFRDDDIAGLHLATVTKARAVLAAALAIAPADLVTRLEAEERLGVDGYGNAAVRIHVPRDGENPPRQLWADLECGLRDLQDPSGLDAQYWKERRAEYETLRHDRRRERKAAHDAQEARKLAERDQELAREWAADPMARALFAVAGDPAYAKFKGLLEAVARAYHRVGHAASNYGGPPPAGALEFLDLQPYQALPFSED